MMGRSSTTTTRGRSAFGATAAGLGAAGLGAAGVTARDDDFEGSEGF